MVVKNDPTLMFTNAGMNQFKDYFLGNLPIQIPRIADTQKCLRVSGKHNDLEEVGLDTYHHTMFEMLGNWSFGDYFKKEAIEWAWELLTEVYKIDKDSLYVTVFEGSKDDKTELDQEAFEIWSKIVDKSKIILGNKKDNFWEMGDFGPCGPCSEIHVDIRSKEEKLKISGINLVNKDHPEVIEIWNLVFIQFNRNKKGTLESLPNKHVDTGMGFERLCMVLQNVKSNYETDIFIPIINQLESISNFKYGQRKEIDVAFRVIVDHLRAVVFSISDGQLPSNNGAGYVIRRILRRAVRYGYTFLNLKTPFIFKLVQTFSKQYSSVFPEVKAQLQIIENVIESEESSFLRTLEKGIIKLDDIISKNSSKTISGSDVFELYDTFGFPVDLTALILRENNLNYDEEEYINLLNAQKNRSKTAISTSNEEWVQISNSINTEFIGYDKSSVKTKILRYRKSINKKGEIRYHLVFESTPFYPEGGGQLGDKGYLTNKDGEKIEILNTFKENDSIIHECFHLPNDLSLVYDIQIDKEKRFEISCNHTSTHLLHQALRSILGVHVQQKGSMVSDKYLRFDFSHFDKINDNQILEIQSFVNKKIDEQLTLEENREANYQDCINDGVIALFGEKYGEKVRSVKFGSSYELCGGTHVSNTGLIKNFIIKSESSISSGIRRIEAISGREAKKYVNDKLDSLNEISSLLNNDKDLVSALHKIKTQNNLLNKKLERLNKKLLEHYLSIFSSNSFKKNNITVGCMELDCDPDMLKSLAFRAAKNFDKLFLVLVSKSEGNSYLTCYISKSLVNDKLNANNIVKKLSIYINGSGGGQAFFANATGNKLNSLSKLLEEALKII